VLDTSTAQAWRNGEYLPLTPLEFEMLRTLAEQPGARMTVGQLLRRVAVRGVRVRRELTEHLVERMQALVNRGRSALVIGDESAGWMLATA
jgi:DNA-binding response OmpR family regulator